MCGPDQVEHLASDVAVQAFRGVPHRDQQSDGRVRADAHRDQQLRGVAFDEPGVAARPLSGHASSARSSGRPVAWSCDSSRGRVGPGAGWTWGC